jgi:hypothetical protein
MVITISQFKDETPHCVRGDYGENGANPLLNHLGAIPHPVISSVARNLLFNRKGEHTPFSNLPQKEINVKAGHSDERTLRGRISSFCVLEGVGGGLRPPPLMEIPRHLRSSG